MNINWHAGVFNKRKSFLSLIYLHVVIHFLPSRALYCFNRIVSKFCRDRSNHDPSSHESFFNEAASELSDQIAAGASFSLPEPAFLRSGFLQSARGLYAFKKFPDTPLLAEYLQCQLEGLRYFDSVFRSTVELRSAYSDLMVRHHRILSTGMKGRLNYRVGFSNEYSTDVAGKLRQAGGRVAFPVRDPRLVKLMIRVLAETGCYPENRWAVKIDGLPRKAWSTAKWYPKGFDIIHPDGEYIPLYFQKMAECLDYLKMLCSKSKSEKTKDLTLRALATYFHLGIHSHAFVRINQSLLWSQVNYMLMLNGYLPVQHEYVDLVAAFLNTGGFSNYFREYVSRRSNDAFSPGPDPLIASSDAERL